MKAPATIPALDPLDVRAGVLTPVVWLCARRLSIVRARRFRELPDILA